MSAIPRNSPVAGKRSPAAAGEVIALRCTSTRSRTSTTSGPASPRRTCSSSSALLWRIDLARGDAEARAARIPTLIVDGLRA
ncbi:hypothetical protein [Streptomyces sp. NPDC001601]|uniref:hypothetical protein n=1 Tax=Streptomyces sp. NPDC001601 TaxID=3364592 RepID=UPI0036840D13